MKKHTILAAFTAIALIFGAAPACTNLDEHIYSSLSPDNLSGTEDEVQDMLGNLYVQLRFMYWSWEGYFDINEESSDLIMSPYRTYGGWGAQYINLHQNNPYAGIPHLWQEWDYCYNGIMKANQLLETESIIENKEAFAEIRAIRALYYFVLFDLWRNIPLETAYEATLEPGYLPEQSAPEHVWDFLAKEVEECIPDMPTAKKYGRMNKYAACMLAAKVFLNHDAWLRGFEKDAATNLVMSEHARNNRNWDSEFFVTNAQNGNKWYKKAYEYAKIVVDEGGYTLAENYLDNSKCNLNTAQEVIFVLPLDGAKASHNYLVNKCFVGRGGAAFGYSGTPWNGSCAVPQFIHSYDPDDTRLTDTWAIGQQYYYSDGFPIYEQEQKRSDNGADMLTDAMIAAEPKHKEHNHAAGNYPLVYTVEVHSINNPGAFDFEGARFKKQEIVPGNRGTYGDDVCFYRLSDAYFIMAETVLRAGGIDGKTDADAAAWVTMVRQRAFKNNPAKAVRTAAQLKGDSVYDYGVRECSTANSANPYADFQFDAAGNPLPSSFTDYTKDNSAAIEFGGLLDDLAWEFVGEHHRRQDLIRFMLSDGRNVYNGKTWFCRKNKMAVGDWHNNVFPIYYEFVQSNVNIKQNYGFVDEAETEQPAG
jgi:hypothetical protein